VNEVSVRLNELYMQIVVKLQSSITYDPQPNL